MTPDKNALLGPSVQQQERDACS